MKKHLVTLLTVIACFTASAQSGKGPKIGYIDMNYILDKVPDYAEAKSQLELKANKWKQEMDVKRNEITKLKESLQGEKALLTKELIEEREEEILFQEKELIDFQDKKFGAKGELITQKAVLVKPIQDQIFTIVQDVAESRKYDFVFDKSSDLTMLFAAKKYDISDFIVKRLSRTAKREKLSTKEVKKLEEQEKKEELDSDPDYVDRAKALEDKKEARKKLIEDRKAAAQAKRDAAIAKREQAIADREARKNGTAPAKAPAAAKTAAAKEATTGTGNANEDDDAAPATATPDKAAAAEAKAEERADKNAAAAANKEKTLQDAKDARAKKLEERNKAIEARKKQLEEQREAARLAREAKKNGTTTPAKSNDTPAQTPAPTDGED